MLAQETIRADTATHHPRTADPMTDVCMATLGDLLEVGQARATAVVVPDGPVLTYADLRSHAWRVADRLAALGLGPRDRVAICMPNGPEAIVAFLGAALVGSAAPLNPVLTEAELRNACRDLDPQALLIGTSGMDAARRVWPNERPVLQICLDGQARLSIRTVATGRVDYASVAARPADVGLVLQTSGTTGHPKRVPLRHQQIVASAQNIVRTYNLEPGDVSLCVMPLFHVHGLIGSVLATLASGGRVVLPPEPDAIGLCQLATTHGVTWYSGVPTFHQLVLSCLRSHSGGPRIPTLRFIRSASSRLGPNTLDALEREFDVPVLEAFGMTEAAHQVASNPLPPASRKASSVGRGTGVQIAIADESGARLGLGAIGEVIIRGLNVIDAYDADPQVNAAAFTFDGWFRTGDLGTLDADGFLSIVGRIKELINRGGEKVAPSEVEDVLLAHPAVAEAVCFGIPHARWGEEMATAVVPRHNVTRSELLAHCRQHLAEFKVPKRLLLVEAIPRTATGKVQRSRVAAIYSEVHA